MKKRQRTLRDLIKEANDQEREQPISASCDGQRIRLNYQSDLPRPKVTLKKPRKQGFGYIELLVCMAIIALLSTLAIPSMRGRIELARRQAVQANTDTLNDAIHDYMLCNGFFERRWVEVRTYERMLEVEELIRGGFDACKVAGYAMDLGALDDCYMSQVIFKPVSADAIYTATE